MKFNVKPVLIGMVAFFVMIFVFGVCVRFTTIEPGYTGLKITKLGSNRGVSNQDIVTGIVFYNPVMSKIIEYPTFNQRVSWTHEINEGKPVNEELTFQTKDSVPVSLDVAVNYSLNQAKVPEFYTKFRADNIEMFTHGYMRDQCRNALSQIGSEYTFDEVNGSKKEEFFTRVNETLIASVQQYGVEISKNGVSSIGALRPPENLKNAINAKVQAIQDAIKSENQLRQIKADAAKAVATAEGEAASNRAKASSLTPALMEWKRLEIAEIQAKKWNGSLPSTMLGSGSNVLFNLK